ncbi:MAG: glycoside hydrolase family 16 protein [Clostridia bacterium]|nr:glycoside hydrolase family 16 protein [Clostridia bacterium]
MLELVQKFLVEILKLCPRQMMGMETIGVRLAQIFDADSIRRFIAGILAVFQLFFAVIFDVGYEPSGQELDLTGYELVFEDEFNGDSLDTTAWKYCNSGPRRGGFRAPSSVKIADGTCTITGEYRDGEYGEGWYGGDLALLKWYNKGYFEIRCKVSAGGGLWSAFWLMAAHPYEAEYSKGGIGGAEIDIMEAAGWGRDGWENAVVQTIHCAGVEGWYEGLYIDREDFDSRELGYYNGNDIYNEYNTYGLEWTEDEYIFYINGVETCRTSFGNGTSQVAEEVRVSLEVPDAEALSQLDKETYHSEFVVDYVRIYQEKPAA